jgi:hypothetical protein
MSYIGLFFAGAFLCNSIPHLCAGLMGKPFPSPFAKPRGVGNSSPIVNFFWGLFNFVVGGWLLSAQAVSFGLTPEFGVALLGAIAIGTHLSVHFGKVQAAKSGGAGQ